MILRTYVFATFLNMRSFAESNLSAWDKGRMMARGGYGFGSEKRED
jgi:hypothetical protein